MYKSLINRTVAVAALGLFVTLMGVNRTYVLESRNTQQDLDAVLQKLVDADVSLLQTSHASFRRLVLREAYKEGFDALQWQQDIETFQEDILGRPVLFHLSQSLELSDPVSPNPESLEARATIKLLLPELIEAAGSGTAPVAKILGAEDSNAAFLREVVYMPMDNHEDRNNQDLKGILILSNLTSRYEELVKKIAPGFSWGVQLNDALAYSKDTNNPVDKYVSESVLKVPGGPEVRYRVTPGKSWVKKVFDRTYEMVLVIGLILTVLLAAVTHQSQRLKNTLSHLREELDKSRLLSEVIEHSSEAIVLLDKNGVIQYVNQAYINYRKFKPKDVIGRSMGDFGKQRKTEDLYAKIQHQVFEEGKPWKGRIDLPFPNGPDRTEYFVVAPVKDEHGKVYAAYVSVTDITAQERAKKQQAQNQRLQSVGQLAAGFAHETNTPLQVILDSQNFVHDACADLQKLSAELGKDAPNAEEKLKKISHLAEEIDLEFICEEVPQAVTASLESATHISNVVKAIKAFSSDGTEAVPFGVNEAIEQAVLAANSEWSGVALLKQELDPEAGEITGSQPQFMQSIVKLLQNAAEAIARHPEHNKPQDGLISIVTRRMPDCLQITISDNGVGVDAAISDRIFEPFFTTKPVGSGTGQGLSFAYETIVNHLGGEIELSSKAPEGAGFSIKIPTHPAAMDDPEESSANLAVAH